MSAPEAVTHSDLEVASPVMFSNSNKSPAPVYSILQPQHDYTQASQQDLGQGYQAVTPEKGERASNTICGVAPKIFFLLLSAIVIALAIGLGAGIGAGMAVQKSK
jgi:ABC-type antimicrobial peptide transport system permease subunit